MQPRQEDSVSTEGNIQFKEAIHIGYTGLSVKEVADLVNNQVSGLCNRVKGYVFEYVVVGYVFE